MQIQLHLQIFSQRTFQQPSGLPNDTIRIDYLQIFGLGSAAKCQQLPYKISGPQAGSFNDFNKTLGFRLIAESMFQQAGIAENASKDIVEIVCDSPGHGADALHFLLVQELGFHSLLFSNVGHHGKTALVALSVHNGNTTYYG